MQRPAKRSCLPGAPYYPRDPQPETPPVQKACIHTYNTYIYRERGRDSECVYIYIHALHINTQQKHIPSLLLTWSLFQSPNHQVSVQYLTKGHNLPTTTTEALNGSTTVEGLGNLDLNTATPMRLLLPGDLE